MRINRLLSLMQIKVYILRKNLLNAIRFMFKR